MLFADADRRRRLTTCVGGPRHRDNPDRQVTGEALQEARKSWTPEQIYRADRTSVITDEELAEALGNAEKIEDTYFRLRSKAVISLIRLSGKRRGEIAMIPLNNFKVNSPYLEVSFILEKKRKTLPLAKISTKRYLLTDPLVSNILEYLAFLEAMNPKPQFWLPSGKVVYGYYHIYPDRHVDGRTVFNIMRDCSQKIWPHLGRETAASDVVQTDDSINGVFTIQQTLDLSDFRTAFNYIRRFSKQIMQRRSVPGAP